jgi:Xaa-Pro aminopeptidase
MTRLERIQDTLGRRRAMLWVAPSEDFFYLMGWSLHADERLTFLAVTPDRVGLVVPSVNAQQAREHIEPQWQVVEFEDAVGPEQAVRRLYDALGGARWQSLISDAARYDHAQTVQRVAGTLGLASTVLAAHRMPKDPDELACLQESQRLNDLAMQAAFSALRPGMTEIELQDVIRQAYAQHGADREAFIIVAAGAHSALPHHIPDRTVITPGPVLIDIGCYYRGYASDMTRVAYLGQPPEPFRAIHAVVNQAVQAALAVVRPGALASQVDGAAREVIDRAGYGSYFVHRTGHGIGVAVHEPPSIMQGNDLALPLHVTFSIEPGIYLPNRFGVRLEEVVVVKETGPEILSAVSREIFVQPV